MYRDHRVRTCVRVRCPLYRVGRQGCGGEATPDYLDDAETFVPAMKSLARLEKLDGDVCRSIVAGGLGMNMPELQMHAR